MTMCPFPSLQHDDTDESQDAQMPGHPVHTLERKPPSSSLMEFTHSKFKLLFCMKRKEKSNNHIRTLCLLERAMRIFSGLGTASIKRETGSVTCLSHHHKALLRIVRCFFLPAFSTVTLCLPLKKSHLAGVPREPFQFPSMDSPLREC